METERAQYQAYMLRMWQDQVEAGNVWRASLESPHTGERHGFTSLEALFDFLRQRARHTAPVSAVEVQGDQKEVLKKDDQVWEV